MRKSGSDTAATTSNSTELSSVASPVTEALASEPDAVDYPERHWIAQSVWHGDGVRLATAALHQHFDDRDNVQLAVELVVYYERGNHRARPRPDVQVAFDVKRAGNCSTSKVWEQDKAPDSCPGGSVAVNGGERRTGQSAGVLGDRGA
ncbi:MAG: hypothetical protein OXJ37_03355 [Bryobacterales bacterium]|nr:hypothetical protein [Bryobacterales bacterium]